MSDAEWPQMQALKTDTTAPNLMARLSLAIRKAWAAPPVGTSSEQAAHAVIAEFAMMGVEAHDMPKLAYCARSAFDRASAAGDEDPFKYVVERILLVASNVPTHAAKYATVPKQVIDEAGLPPRPDHAQGIVNRLARTIYGVEERARRPSPVLFDDLYAQTREDYRSAARAVLADLTAMGMDVLGGPLSGSDEMLETASDYAARAAAKLWAKGWRAVIDGRNLNQKMYDAFQSGARWAYSQVAPIMAAKDTTLEETNRKFAWWRAESQRTMPSRPTNWVAMLQKERDAAISGRVDILAERECVDRQTETGEFVKPASTNEDGIPPIADPVARAEAVSFALRCRGIRASNIGARITTPCRRRDENFRCVDGDLASLSVAAIADIIQAEEAGMIMGPDDHRRAREGELT